MQMNTLQDLFVDQLKDLYNAESQLVKSLPKMAKAAHNPMLQQAFSTHLEQTKRHVERLTKVFESIGATPRGKKCHAMEGLIEEGKEMIDEDASPEIKDAGLIAAAQRVEHYEIAGYGCVRTYARMLGNTKASQLLQETLNEESQTDEMLTDLAERVINVKAQA